MQNAGLQYVEGVTPVPESPFGVTQMQNNSTSSTSSLRQFRKKDNVDKTPGAVGGHSASSSRTDSLNSSHVARVAPHNHYPHKQNEYFRYPPQYQEYSSPYKDHTVKYSEIAEPVPQAIPHLEHLPPSVLSKHKEKDYADMCNIPQQPHLNKPFSEHQYNGQQSYPTEMALHHQYMQKEPQTQMHSPYKPESQYIPKEGAFNHQISPFLKYNIPTQSRNYGHLENTSLGSFQRMDSHIARSLMSDHPHIRDFPGDYGAMEQSRMYAQKQRYYPAPLPPTNPTYPPNYPHRNIPTQQYNYPNCNYPRTAQVNSSMGRYPINMERSMSPRRTYPENLDMGMNYSSVPQKISSAYPNYPAYAQHYQHRRPSAVPQEYYHHQQHPQARPHPQYMPTHHPQEVAENHVASNNIRQYLENWAEEESTTEICPQIDNPKYIPRINRDEANEVYVINASELPQYLENGVPLVTSENGQYIFKSNVSIDNTGAIKILEKTVENAVLPTDTQERVVSLHIIENPKADCLINTRTTNMNQEHPGSANQVPAATINVITTNNNHSNQDHAVQNSYNVTSPAFNANKMHVMHQVPPMNQNGPQHNSNYENSVNLCLHPNMPGENNSTSQQPITSNSASLENTIRLSPHIQPVEKSSELSQRVQNNSIVDESSSEKNRLKIQAMSYQEVPQNSCIVMPSTQNRLNFDESLLPNQVPSDPKGAKNVFEVRNVDGDEDSAISNVITSNDNILHEELDKIVEDTLTSSNINIPLVSCERNHLPKIQEKCDSANTSVNPRIPDDLNLDLESNPKDLTNSISDYTMESNCSHQNEDIIDLSTSRRGSKNDNEVQDIQNIKPDISSSNIHNKLEQISQEAHIDLPILSEYASSSVEDVTTVNNSEKQEEPTSPKLSMKHMPLIEDNLEARSTLSHSESLVVSDSVIDPKNSSDTGEPVDQEKTDGSNEENVNQGEREIEETAVSMSREIPIAQSDTSDTLPVGDISPLGRQDSSEITSALDTSLEAKLSEIVGEPYRLPEKASIDEESTSLNSKEKEENKQDDNSGATGDHEENCKEETKNQPEEIFDSSVELSKNSNVQVMEETEDVSCGKSAALIENKNENIPLKTSDDSSVEKKREGSRKRRIFSVDDIIYRIGPNLLQNRRDSIPSTPDSDCTPDIFLEEIKDHPQHISHQGSDSDVIREEKMEESGISSKSTEDIQAPAKENSGNDVISPEVICNLQESKNAERSSIQKNEIVDKPLSPATTSDSRPSYEDKNISKGNTADNKLTEERIPNNIEAIVSMENIKHSGSEEMSIDMPKENVFEGRCAEFHSSHLEGSEAESIQSIVSPSSEIKTHLLASEDIISVDRTLEFISSIETNSPEIERVQETENIKCDMSIEELPPVRNRNSEEMDVPENQELGGKMTKKIHKEIDIIRNPEIIENQDHNNDESALPISQPAGVQIEEDIAQMDCSEGANGVEKQNEGSAIEPSKLFDVRMEDESQNDCSKYEDTVENQEENSSKESYNVPSDSYAIPEVPTKDTIQNCSKTEDLIENHSQPLSLLPACRFSVIHKIEDSNRIIHQENIRTEENYEANISKINMIDSRKPSQTSEPEFSERKIDELKVFPNETSENQKATTPNHCSVIQSIEGMMNDEIIQKTMEIVEQDNEEKSSELKEEYKETSNSPCSGLPQVQTVEGSPTSTETSNKSENMKCTSILAKKEELTFEQKFVEPFCSKSEENIQKTEDIEEKSHEEIQFRSVLKIEENNVLLEIGGELVEITVNQVNGKNVITVTPMSNTATVDFNDNYENIDRAQMCEDTDDAEFHEDVREAEITSLLEETREESKRETAMNEDHPESSKITIVSEEVGMANRSEFISSTQSESIGDIFEDIILNDNEIIIGDESLEEEINLDLQSKDAVEIEEPRQKPTLCTKASKKLYDDPAFHIPNKTYSSLREFRRIKSKPESSTTDCGEEAIQSKGKRSSKRSIRISTRKRSVSEQNEGSQTALRELIERRKMRKEKIRLKYTQYAKQESRVLIDSINADSLNIEQDDQKVQTVPSEESKMERLSTSSLVKKTKTKDELKRREFKKKMNRCNENIRKKPAGKKNEQNDSLFRKGIISSDSEIEKKKPEEKPTSTSVIVSSTISTTETSPTNFHEARTTTAMEISKNSSSQDKTQKFPKISTPRDLSLTKNVNEHYLSRKDHSNLKKKLSIQEYNSRKRKTADCKNSVPEKSMKPADELGNASEVGEVGGVAKPSTIYSDKQLECLPNSVKDPRRRLHCTNMHPVKLQRTQSEDLHKFQTQNISSSRLHKLGEGPHPIISLKHKDPLLNSNESNLREVNNYKNYKTLLLGKSSVDKYIPKPTKISTRRKTIEVMNDRRFDTTEMIKKKVSFDDNVQINEINTTQTRTASVKQETTNYCEVTSSCSDILEDKNSEDSADQNIEEPSKGVKNTKFESDEKRKSEWEDSNSPRDSITDVFADSFLDKTRIDNLKTKNKGKCIIDISDFDTSLINNELKSPYGCCYNNTTTYVDAGSLKDYKEEVDSKLNTLNIQIPKNTKSRIINEDDALIHKFLRKEQLNSEEIKQIRRIIYLKKKIQQITHQNANVKNENESYEVKNNFEYSSHKDLKLQLKKIDGRPKKKKRRFRNLYSESPESSEGEVQGTAGEFSVYEGENISGVKLIFRRKTDLVHLQPVVKLQRCKYIESMAKKLKIE